MKQQWQNYSDRFLQLTSREQFLVLITGLVAIFFISSYLFIDEKSTKSLNFEKQSKSMRSSIKTLNYSIEQYQAALQLDPNTDTLKQIEQLETKLDNLDSQLVLLTTELISPTEMREALLKLLKLEPGVSLSSFELIGAKPLLEIAAATANSQEVNTMPSSEQLGLNLYKHGIKLKLSGEYFQLRNYLQQLEQLKWKFFWQDFQLQVTEYPLNEVEVIIYSLGLNKEFIGV
ncbi:hypothetical protein [Colwellia echini]|uniref:MSHA biogenesis protein MshJ n=1 Tax=Colwellia echini TaxID=1982103 RepID=A0ABY3N0W8_9GAMM|nr:hypothetical protein [Colwellia echini]TYK67138.1 hypothetical protein CWS31_000970 [Colwellia echini]